MAEVSGEKPTSSSSNRDHLCLSHDNRDPSPAPVPRPLTPAEAERLEWIESHAVHVRITGDPVIEGEVKMKTSNDLEKSELQENTLVPPKTSRDLSSKDTIRRIKGRLPNGDPMYYKHKIRIYKVQTFSIVLRLDHAALIDKKAKELHVSKSKLIREALKIAFNIPIPTGEWSNEEARDWWDHCERIEKMKREEAAAFCEQHGHDYIDDNVSLKCARCKIKIKKNRYCEEHGHDYVDDEFGFLKCSRCNTRVKRA